jgi:hypothetical protein
MQDLTPDVYYNNSRDFQFIGRLFDLVLNATKTEADILFSLPLSANSPDHLLSLMATTFGLRLDITKYTSTQLRAICSVAPKLMKYKGSLRAIHYLCSALLRTEGMAEEYLIEQDLNNPCHIIISLPTQAKHKAILDELLPYITPAGITYSIRQAFFTIKQQEEAYGIADEVMVGTEYSTARAVLVEDCANANLADMNFFIQLDTGDLNSKPSHWPTASLAPDYSSTTRKVVPDAAKPIPRAEFTEDSSEE